MALDSTYPLYPIVSALSATMSLCILLSSLSRPSGNLNPGVASLCFWLFLENMTGGINAIAWSDSADVKHHVYCDIGTSNDPVLQAPRVLTASIVSRVNLICPIAKSTATFVIMRRLDMVARLQLDSLKRTQVRYQGPMNDRALIYLL